jgi:hypothetical protein
MMNEILGSHSGEYEDGCFLVCCAVESVRNLQTFHKCVLAPSSGRSPALLKRQLASDYTAQQLREQLRMMNLLTFEYSGTSAALFNTL